MESGQTYSSYCIPMLFLSKQDDINWYNIYIYTVYIYICTYIHIIYIIYVILYIIILVYTIHRIFLWTLHCFLEAPAQEISQLAVSLQGWALFAKLIQNSLSEWLFFHWKTKIDSTNGAGFSLPCFFSPEGILISTIQRSSDPSVICWYKSSKIIPCISGWWFQTCFFP